MMLAEGARVAISGRDIERLKAAALELGGNTLPVQGDLGNSGGIAQTIARVREEFGALDVLFANAGISGLTAVGTTGAEIFESIVRTNFTSVFFTIQEALPLLNAGSAIVLNGSIMRSAGMTGFSAYAGSKAAVTGMAKVLAAELAPRGIRVNTVVPGGTKTPMWTRGARPGMTVDVAEQRMSPVIPLRRFSEADEVARAVLFLACDDSSGTTAAEVVVDGGMSGAPFASMGAVPPVTG
jgi:NAD(P)-dependent dehydrogenase (short-subunit alcohol dehydrogenase family)